MDGKYVVESMDLAGARTHAERAHTVQRAHARRSARTQRTHGHIVHRAHVHAQFRRYYCTTAITRTRKLRLHTHMPMHMYIRVVE